MGERRFSLVANAGIQNKGKDQKGKKFTFEEEVKDSLNELFPYYEEEIPKKVCRKRKNRRLMW